MGLHECVCGRPELHPEQPARIELIYNRLSETGLLGRTTPLKPRKCTLEELLLVHTEAYISQWVLDCQQSTTGARLGGEGRVGVRRLRERLSSGEGSGATSGTGDVDPEQQSPEGAGLGRPMRLPCGGWGADADTVWNEQHTINAARIAVGIVSDLAIKIANTELRNGFAIVRPPGIYSPSLLHLCSVFSKNIPNRNYIPQHFYAQHYHFYSKFSGSSLHLGPRAKFLTPVQFQ